MAKSTQHTTLTALFLMLVGILLLPSPSYSESPNFDTKKINNQRHNLPFRAEQTRLNDLGGRAALRSRLTSDFGIRAHELLQTAEDIECSFRELVGGETFPNFVRALFGLSSNGVIGDIASERLGYQVLNYLERANGDYFSHPASQLSFQAYDHEQLIDIAYDIFEAFEAYEHRARMKLQGAVETASRRK